jgi:hypothetical protein
MTDTGRGIVDIQQTGELPNRPQTVIDMEEIALEQQAEEESLQPFGPTDRPVMVNATAQARMSART